MDKGFEKASKAIGMIDFLESLAVCGFSYEINFDPSNQKDSECIIFVYNAGELIAENEGFTLLEAFEATKKEVNKEVKKILRLYKKRSKELNQLCSLIDKHF